MPARAQRSLVKPFEPSSLAAACDGRRFGPDDHEANLPLLAEAGDRVVIANIERCELRDPGDPGIARGAIESIKERALLELPGKRVLAASSTYQQHVQWGKAPVCQAASLARGRQKQNGTADLECLKPPQICRPISSNIPSPSFPSRSSAPWRRPTGW